MRLCRAPCLRETVYGAKWARFAVWERRRARSSPGVGGAVFASANASSVPFRECDTSLPRALDGRLAIKGLSHARLEEWLVSLGEKPSRATQLFAAMYRTRTLAASREALVAAGVGGTFAARVSSEADFCGELALKDRIVSRDGTQKLLFTLLNGGGTVESVIIPSPNRTTLCISSQLGCALNCQFCHTALMGLRRHLTTAQIVEQVVQARRLYEHGKGTDRITNIVFMGMGEPLHNAEAVIRAVDILGDPRGLAFAHRRITVSTSGLVPEVRRFLAASAGGANLAVSLNATTDEVRSWIMPINRKYNLEALLGTLAELFPKEQKDRRKRGQRKVLFEYIMLSGINDTDEDIDRLVDITSRLSCKLNLIHFNPHAGAPQEFTPTPPERVREFRAALAARTDVLVTVRESRGDDEMAACGQLGAREDAWDAPVPPRLKPPPRFRNLSSASASAPDPDGGGVASLPPSLS